MAPAKNQQVKIARIRALASWGGKRSVDAPPRRISEVLEPESFPTEALTPVPTLHEHGGPGLDPQAVLLLHLLPKEPHLILFQYKHCQFCADFSMDLMFCVKCKKKVCSAMTLGGSGCVLKETMPPEMMSTFKCPDCHEGPMAVSIGDSYRKSRVNLIICN
jgi:hypothetical protein